MHRFFSGLFPTRDTVEPYVRLAEVEYGAEYRHFVKSLGRKPTNQEAKLFLLGFGK